MDTSSNKWRKRLTPPTIRKTQIKNHGDCQHVANRTPKLKTLDSRAKCCQLGCGTFGTLRYISWECKTNHFGRHSGISCKNQKYTCIFHQEIHYLISPQEKCLSSHKGWCRIIRDLHRLLQARNTPSVHQRVHWQHTRIWNSRSVMRSVEPPENRALHSFGTHESVDELQHIYHESTRTTSEGKGKHLELDMGTSWVAVV